LVGVFLLAAFSSLWGLNPLVYLLAAIFGLIEVVLNFYFFAIIIVIIISWVASGSYNPAVALLSQVTEPVMAPFRRILPAMGGLDFSPMVVLFIIHVLRTIILPAMMASVGG